MEDKELLNFLYYLHHRTETRIYDTFNNLIEGYHKFNDSASNESLSVRDNEGQKENCPFCESSDTYIQYEPVGNCNKCKKTWAI